MTTEFDRDAIVDQWLQDKFDAMERKVQARALIRDARRRVAELHRTGQETTSAAMIRDLADMLEKGVER